jgi:hypothetical protein
MSVLLLFRFSWLICLKDKRASFADAYEYGRDYRPPNVWRDHIWLLELNPRYVRGAPVRILQGG